MIELKIAIYNTVFLFLETDDCLGENRISSHQKLENSSHDEKLAETLNINLNALQCKIFAFRVSSCSKNPLSTITFFFVGHAINTCFSFQAFTVETSK